MQKLVDIVIPMYNRAHCIANLIEELKKQTMQDFCAIFVDDGSTDNTYQMLEEVASDLGLHSSQTVEVKMGYANPPADGTFLFGGLRIVKGVGK